jgi:hypothetical protein
MIRPPIAILLPLLLSACSKPAPATADWFDGPFCYTDGAGHVYMVGDAGRMMPPNLDCASLLMRGRER